MKKPGIPAIPPMEPQIADVLNSLKINVEQLTGVRGGPIAELDAAATLPQAVSKINEILRRLNIG